MTVTTENQRILLRLEAVIALKRKMKLTQELKERVLKEGRFTPIFDLHDITLEQSECEEASKILEQCKQNKISTVTFLEEDYPNILREIYDPPLILFYKGDSIKYLNTYNSFAIVGSRNADLKGIEIAKELGRALAQKGLNIVSGLALGIDAAAHRGALESNVPQATAAVLGHGLALRTYPAKNRPLEDQILKNGGIVMSHFLPEAKPLPYNFLDRNRIVSGLCNASIIVQATKRSGSLSTARHCNEQGRDVLVVPGNFGSLRYEGSHELIKSGALLINSVNDIEKEYSELFSSERIQNSIFIDEEVTQDKRGENLFQQQIRSAFSLSKEQSLEDLQNVVSDEGILAENLLELELVGFIKRLPGMRYIKT